MTLEKGQLVQIYRNDLAKSIGSERKLTPMWSEPHRVTEKMLNSYKLETLDGQQLEGEYHARRLRGFVPREGTELATQQKEWELEARTPVEEEETNKEAESEEGEAEETTSTEELRK